MSRRLGWRDIDAALKCRVPRTLDLPCSRRAAVALVLRESRGELELLFVRRAEHPDDPWSGHMAFPGGRAEPADRDLLATSVRETLEEAGLDLDADGRVLGTLDELQAMQSGGPVDLSITPFVFRLSAQRAFALGDEVVSAHWTCLDTLLAPETHGAFEINLLGAQRVLPCLRIDSHVIWGLTYRMFADLAERLRLTREQRQAESEEA
jgi:8-oxo-dGTP pyrophosphatase MutT (NUDIX family)